MKYIYAIGLEVESAFDEDVYGLEGNSPYISDVKDDASIELEEYDMQGIEVTSNKLYNIKSCKQFFKEIKPYIYDDYINDSMGFHVHISMNRDSYYSILYSRKFVEHFRTSIAKLGGDVINRLNNSYCYDRYNDDYFCQHFPWEIRSFARDFDRYKMINFLSAFSKFGTMEFRIFPSSDVDTMMKYVEFTVKCINKYLDKHLCEFGCRDSIELVRGFEENKTVDYVLMPSDNTIAII